MYGYVCPFKPELKIRDFELYRSVYCGLCHRLKAKYGHFARFAVSYDMTLPALVLATGEYSFENLVCPASPHRKKCAAVCGPGLDAAADMTVILAFHKFRDTVFDSGFFKGIPARAALLFSRRAYKKAAAARPEFDSLAAGKLAELTELEKNGGGPDILDRSADCFALITAGFSLAEPDGARRRVLREFFYHIGRAVYILDAADDCPEDIKNKNFNPAALRYGTENGGLSDSAKTEIAATAEHSLAAAGRAFDLLESFPGAKIVENIVFLGMGRVLHEVLYTDKKDRKKKSRRDAFPIGEE